MRRVELSVFACCALLAFAAASGEPHVRFELATDAGFPVNGARDWLELFKALDETSIRIRSGRPGDKDQIETRGTEARPTYHVVGILTARNQLYLPGGEFTLRDRTRLKQWIEKLKANGPDGFTRQKAAFGLSSEELVAFHDRLAKSVEFETKDRRAGDVARAVVKDLRIDYHVTPQSRQAFARNELVLDELTGMSSGTVLAATLRPLGLVMAPSKQPDGAVVLIIADFRELEESWPVGWPSGQNPRQLAPSLFTREQIEINDFPLDKTLAAIQPRVDTPFLLDHNSLARSEIDPATAKVSFNSKRTSYKRALDNLLFQAKLRSELRVDEAGKTFVWISTRKR